MTFKPSRTLPITESKLFLPILRSELARAMLLVGELGVTVQVVANLDQLGQLAGDQITQFAHAPIV